MEEKIKIDDDNFGKSEDDINIDEIKKSELLDKEQMEDILINHNKTKNDETQNNVSDKEMIRAVWSLYKQYNNQDDIGDWCFNFIAQYIICCISGRLIKRDKNSSQTKEFKKCNEEDRINVYKFFWCLWKLNIKAKDLPWNRIQMTHVSDSMKMPSSNVEDFYNEKYGFGGPISNILYGAKSIDYDFAIWLCDSRYVIETHSYHWLQRDMDYIGDSFSSYSAFENFVKGDKNKYGIKVSVQSLHDVLKKKPSYDKFLTKDEFIQLIKDDKIAFKKPDYIADSEIPNWSENYVYHIWQNVHEKPDLKKLKQADKDYWQYVKKHLFGDPDGTVKGLLDIKNLEENDIKELLSWILVINCDNQNRDKDENEVSFAFLNLLGEKRYHKDIFRISKDFATIKVNDKLSRINFFDLQNIENRSIKKKLNFFVNDLIEYRNEILGLNKSSNKKRFIAGIVLIAVGILACVIDLLVLGLASKLAIVLFLLSLLITAVGVVCLVWKQIFDCVRSCVPISNSVILEPESSSRIILDQSNDLNVKPDKFPDDEIGSK